MAEQVESLGMSDEMIASAIRSVRERREAAEQGRAELERSIAAAREEERLLERLLRVRKGDQTGNDEVSAGSESSGRAMSNRDDAPGSGKHPVVDAVFNLLTGARSPLHISDLMRRLQAERVAIPGSGTQANLIAHLRRDKRLVRPSRGMYGLANWGLEEMPATKRRRRKKRRRGKGSAAPVGK